MDEKTLKKLLHEKKEQDWFDFKGKLEIYQSNGKLVEKQRDELLKDILGLANGNSHIIRKTKYLIVGVDDSKFDENGMRVFHNVNYKVPEQSEIIKWLQSACAPAIVGLECELVPFQAKNLFVITIPPTFELHETIRELNASGHFQKHVVFMRQDEHTVPASVREGATIQQLKVLHRQEISNPSAIWIGAISGAIVALLIGTAKINATQIDLDSSKWFVQLLFIVLGVFFGGVIGLFAKQWNETRYDWRYMRFWQRVALIIGTVLCIVIVNLVIK
jgi:hypothetical protein